MAASNNEIKELKNGVNSVRDKMELQQINHDRHLQTEVSLMDKNYKELQKTILILRKKLDEEIDANKKNK